MRTSRTLFIVMIVAASLCLGCSWDTERKRWSTWTAETKEDLKTATGSNEFTGLSSRSREIEKSLDSHQY
jgi:hypothetical protein